MFLLAPVPLHLLFWEQRCWFTEQELWQAACTAPPHPLNAAALVAQTSEGTFESSVNPLLSPILATFYLHYPEKLFLCLEFASLDLKHTLGFKQQSENFTILSWFMETSLICCQLHSALLNSLMHGQGRWDRVEREHKGWWPAEVWPCYLASGEMGRT